MACDLDLEALVRVPSVMNFEFAQDGKKVAYTSNKSGRWEIYLYQLTTSEEICITSGPERKTEPRFSPDSRYIAYMQDYQGDENFNVLIFDTESGNTTNITNQHDYAIYPGVSWSPDGKSIAFISNQNGTFATYVMSAQGGDVKRITNHNYSDGEVEWSPDGKWLAVGAQTEGLSSGLFVVAADGSGATKELTENNKRIDASGPNWSPDSQTVAFESNEHGSYQIGLWEIETGAVTWLTQDEWDTNQPHYSPDGTRIAFVSNHDANLNLATITLADKAIHYYQIMRGVYSSPQWSPDGDTLVFRYSGPRSPNDLWLLSLGNGTRKQITDLLPSSIERNYLVEPSVVRYPSRKAGDTVPALLYQPLGLGSAKAGVVYVHGGPTAQQLNGWAADIQYLVSRGYVVICPNYRGSTGYGKTWQEANRYNLGIGDLQDVMGAADYLVSQNLADKDKLSVTGGSYGGYMTMMAITKYPDEWAASVSIVPFLNWFTEYEHEREDLQYYDRQMMGDPDENHDRWHDCSPINFLQDIKTPVLLIAGAHDPRCPAEETQQAIDKLAELGKTYEAQIYPDEGHGFARIENRIDAIRRQVEFLEKYCPPGTNC